MEDTQFKLKDYKISLFNLVVYKKFLRKSLLLAVLPGLFLFFMGLLMGAIFPEFKGLLKEGGDFAQILEAGFYQAIIPGAQSIDFTKYEGFWAMEILTILDFFTLFLTVFIPVRLIATEVDKNTLDITLSYPIPRWQFLFQKFLVYLTQVFTFIILIVAGAVISTVMIGETFNYQHLLMTAVAIFILFFTLGSLSLLAAAIFLESGKSFAISGVLVVGMWLLNSIGKLAVLGGEQFKSLELLRNLSIHYYLVPGEVFGTGTLPFVETLIVIGIGILAFIGALFIFQKKELAY